MFRPSLVLLALAAIAAGGANLYLGGVEAARSAERRLDERLDRAAKALRTILAEDAQRAAGAAPADSAESDAQASPAFDDARARRLSALAGADVTLVRAGKVEASSLGASARTEVARAASAASAASFNVGEIPEGELELFGLPLPLFAADRAAIRGHGSAIPGVEKLEAVVSVSTLDAYGAIAAGQKRELAIDAALVLVALILLVVPGRRKESGKTVATLADVAERAADGDATAHAAEFLPGDLGRLARALNRLATRSRQASATHSVSSTYALPKRAEDEPPEDVADSFPFGGSGPSLLGASPGPVGAPEPEASPFDDSIGGAPRAHSEPTPGPFGDPFEAGPAEAAAQADDAEAPTWEKTRAPAPTTPPSAPEWEPPAPAAVGSFEPSPGPPPPPSDPYGQAIAEAAGGGTFNPEATVVAAIPEALLRATSRASVPTVAVDPEELHIEQVFQEFVRLRSECGESVAGLTLEKFAAKLRNNRAQLMEKYHCRTVRFTAYVKDGKAALKASPVKDSA